MKHEARHFLEVLMDQPLYLAILMLDMVLLGFLLLHLMARLSSHANLHILPRRYVRTLTLVIMIASFCLYLETGR